MDIENAWNLGLWRGERKRARVVPLAPEIDRTTYLAGYDYGRDRAAARAADRETAPRTDARQPDQRRPDRRQHWTPGRGRRAA
ncbi:hypothetical protein ACLBYG_22290 [Methylobacterium sp. D53M]